MIDNKKKILRMTYKAESKIEYKRFEILINSKLFNNEESVQKPIWGFELIEILENMQKEELISSDDSNWYYSITNKGLDYLQQNKEEE
ncbi:hypothetical protein [Lacinutrix salivirga]